MPKPITIYISVLLFLASIGTAASLWVISELDPSEGWLNVMYFYLATGFAVMVISSLVMLSLRHRFGTKEFAKRNLLISLRQGAWIAIFYVTALILQSEDLFTWLNSLFLLVALSFLEGYFIYNERSKSAKITNTLNPPIQ